jgi:hypothetical protein
MRGPRRADAQIVALRIALFLVPAAALAGVDLLVKAEVTTTSWDFHHRSLAWSVLAFVWLAVLLVLAALPSRLSAVAAGIVAGGVAGNVISARCHDGRVPNPLVALQTAFNLADIWILAGLPLLMFALARLAIRHRATIDRFVPPRRWELALRRKLGL